MIKWIVTFNSFFLKNNGFYSNQCDKWWLMVETELRNKMHAFLPTKQLVTTSSGRSGSANSISLFGTHLRGDFWGVWCGLPS